MNKFESEVRTDSDYDELPIKATFEIDAATATEIRKLAGIVTANGLHKVEKFDYRTVWLNEDGERQRVDADSLNVTDIDFWFSAYLKHTDVEVCTNRYRIADLAPRTLAAEGD